MRLLYVETQNSDLNMEAEIVGVHLSDWTSVDRSRKNLRYDRNFGS